MNANVCNWVVSRRKHPPDLPHLPGSFADILNPAPWHQRGRTSPRIASDPFNLHHA
jgi:hypothetical protein